MKNLLTFILLTVSSFAFGQNKFSLSFGGGYKANYSSYGLFIVGYKLNNSLEVNIAPSLHYLYGGLGTTAGLKINYCHYKRFFLNSEIAYRHLFKRTTGIGYDNDKKEVNYLIPSNDFTFLAEGINFVSKYDESKNIKSSWNVSLYYGLGFKDYHWQYVSGDQSSSIENQIQNRLDSGFGFAVTYTVRFE